MAGQFSIIKHSLLTHVFHLRPDQSPGDILAHLQQWRQIPVHTISFNCADTKANTFLARLAAVTDGR